MKKVFKSEGGLTIIEILIVLAIVGLLILIVFLTVPTVQRNARNTQRKQDVSRALSYLQEVTVNNGGRYPDSCNNFKSDCFVRDITMTFYTHNKDGEEKAISYDKDFSPGGEQLDVNDVDEACTSAEEDGNAATPATGKTCKDTNFISMRAWAVCDANNMFTRIRASKKNVAAQYAIETATGYILACQDS